MQIVIVNFVLDGITEGEYRELCGEVAPAFAAVAGLVSKVWLVDPDEGVYGGVYTFADGDAVDEFLGSDLFAQVSATPGLANISVRRFGVLAAPTVVTRGLTVAAA